MQPISTRDLLQARADLIQAFRGWFHTLGLLEVDAPVLARASVCDPNIPSLSTQYQQETFYLQTSPEFAMKRLIADGAGAIYHIGKVFRDDPNGRHHNPEFTMIEWYRMGLDYRALRVELADFLSELLDLPTFLELSFQDAFLQICGWDPLKVESSFLESQCQDVEGELDRDGMLDWILTRDVLPAFSDQGIVLYDYPASQAALAKVSGEVAERFEIIVNGVELANGYTELTDADQQIARFDAENARRRKQSMHEMPIDQHFIAALRKGLPDCAGVALGLDRLLMLKLGANALDQISPFTIDRV